jgi:hypothetical protein
MERRQYEKEGELESSYSPWVYSTFNIPKILSKGFADLSTDIVPPFPMYVGFQMVLPTTYSP